MTVLERNGDAGGLRVAGAEGERGPQAAGRGSSAGAAPDPELVEKPKRRRFTAEYKLRNVREAEACTRPGEIGALLRREGLYSSLLTEWRRAHETGALGALERPRGRPKTDPRDTENAELRRRLERAEAELEKARKVIEVQGNVSALLGELLEPKAADGDGISLLVVERGMDGFARTSMEKIGQHAHDTAELSLIDTPVPVDNLLGEEGEGFKYLSLGLPLERLSIASSAVSAIEAALRDTIAYVRERQAFGQRIGTFQSTRFSLAALHGEAKIARAYVDRCVTALNARELTIKDAAVAK